MIFLFVGLADDGRKPSSWFGIGACMAMRLDKELAARIRCVGEKRPEFGTVMELKKVG